MNTPATVYYSHLTVDGFGDVWFAVSPRGLWRVEFGKTKTRFLRDLKGEGVMAEPDERATAPVRRQLRDYFSGRTPRSTIKIDWSRVAGFTRRALQVCARISPGQTLSYGEVARRAGSPGGARAAGAAMAHNPFPIIVPCHRVVKSDGSLGGFSGGLRYKRFLLQLENARFRP